MSSEVWGVSGIDSRGETNEVRWTSSPLSVSVTGKCGLAFTGQPAIATCEEVLSRAQDDRKA